MNSERPIRTCSAVAINALLLSTIPLAFGTTGHAFESGQVSLPLTATRIDQQNDTPQPLQRLTPVERTIVGTNVHRYQFLINYSEFVRLVISQQGIDVTVSLKSSEGIIFADVNESVGPQGEESVSLVAKSSGTYVLEIRAVDKDAPAGRYTVTIETIRPSTENDRSEVSAETSFREGEQLFGRGSSESLRMSIKKYEEALKHWQASKNLVGAAKATSRLASVNSALDEYSKAIELYAKSLQLYQALGDRSGQAHALNGMGNVHLAAGNNTNALENYIQSLEIRKAMGNRLGEAYTLGNIGIVYWGMGDLPRALEHYDRGLSIMRDLNHKEGEAFLLYRTGLAFASLSDNAKALDYYDQALRLQRLLRDRRSEASTLNNIGLVYAALGDDEKALEHYDLALSIRREEGYRTGWSITLRNIGDVYVKKNDMRKALGYYEQALPLSEATGDRRGRAYILDSIGVTYWKSGDYKKALSYFSPALNLFHDVDHKTGEASTLANLGSTYFALGQKQKAMECFERALSLFRVVEDRPGEIRTLYEIALLERSQGNFVHAHSRIKDALDLTEVLRSKSGSQELRASYFATVQNYYELAIDILMQLHRQSPSRRFDSLALQISEKARARSLLETVTNSGVDLTTSADPQLTKEQRILRQQLDDKIGYRTRLLNDKHPKDTIAAVQRDIDTLSANLDSVQSKLKGVSPHFSALTQAQPLTVKEIQDSVLDSDTLLLEFALTNDRSFLWAVTRSSVRSFELPKRSDVERVARQLRESLSARNEHPKNESPERRAKRLATADADYAQAARLLSQMLIDPIASELGRRRLLIVADGALQYVPFAALPVPKNDKLNSGTTMSKMRPLIVDHEIINIPSASIVAILRREAAMKNRGAKTLIVFADPIFTSTDSRIKGTATVNSQSSEDSKLMKGLPDETSAAARIDAEYPRLIFSRNEAQAILSFVPEMDRKEAFDFNATRELAISRELEDYRIVHFATHARIDDANPQRSEVVLSRFKESGKLSNGSLSLADIYRLKLSAELVVLSGCETALGKEIRGEGLISLARGFMYSGSLRVLATLWRIDDRVTWELMKRFYESMFMRGRSPAAALREAQIEILRKQNWTHPYYWAAFVIQGEPNQMK